VDYTNPLPANYNPNAISKETAEWNSAMGTLLDLRSDALKSGNTALADKVTQTMDLVRFSGSNNMTADNLALAALATGLVTVTVKASDQIDAKPAAGQLQNQNLIVTLNPNLFPNHDPTLNPNTGFGGPLGPLNPNAGQNSNPLIPGLGDFFARFSTAVRNSIEFEGSYGVGVGVKGKLITAKGEFSPFVLKQTHSWNLSSGEYQQRNHVVSEAEIALWKDKFGARAGASHGWTYSNMDGYKIENGRIMPSTEASTRAYAGGASAGWGHDGRDGDWRIGFGAGAYIIIGWDAEINFNISEYNRQMGR